MGTLQEAARDARLQEIEDICKVPRSIKQIAEHCKTSYYTARSDVKQMVATKRLRPGAGTADDGSMTFVTGEIRPMPEFHQSSANRMVTLKDLAHGAAIAAAAKGNKASAAAVGVLTVAADLLNKVAFMESGGTIEAKHLAEVRRELAAHMTHLNSITKIGQQMLDSHVLWNPERLAAIALDETWNAKDAEKWYGEVLENSPSS